MAGIWIQFANRIHVSGLCFNLLFSVIMWFESLPLVWVNFPSWLWFYILSQGYLSASGVECCDFVIRLCTAMAEDNMVPAPLHLIAQVRIWILQCFGLAITKSSEVQWTNVCEWDFHNQKRESAGEKEGVIVMWLFPTLPARRDMRCRGKLPEVITDSSQFTWAAPHATD